MAKITLDPILTSFSSANSLNARFQAIEDALNFGVFWRDNPPGEPNALITDMDMNSQRILNLPDGVEDQEPLTVAQGKAIVAGSVNADLIPFTDNMSIETFVGTALRQAEDDIDALEAHQTVQDNAIDANAVAVADAQADADAALTVNITQQAELDDHETRISINEDDIIVLQAAPGALTGSILIWPSSTTPLGYMECDGSEISRTTYAALFAVLGVTYGIGDGSTTFNLPDLRGEFIRGWDDGRGVDPGRGIGTNQTDEFKSHDHVSETFVSGVTGTGISQGFGGGAPNNTARTTSSTGGTETRPRNVAMMYIIKE